MKMSENAPYLHLLGETRPQAVDFLNEGISACACGFRKLVRDIHRAVESLHQHFEFFNRQSLESLNLKIFHMADLAIQVNGYGSHGRRISKTDARLELCKNRSLEPFGREFADSTNVIDLPRPSHARVSKSLANEAYLIANLDRCLTRSRSKRQIRAARDGKIDFFMGRSRGHLPRKVVDRRRGSSNCSPSSECGNPLAQAITPIIGCAPYCVSASRSQIHESGKGNAKSEAPRKSPAMPEHGTSLSGHPPPQHTQLTLRQALIGMQDLRKLHESV